MSESNYEMVREFHVAFGHKVGQGEPLTVAERYTRVLFLAEEVREYLEAAVMSEQIDALLDCAYFAYGTAVNIGVAVNDPEGERPRRVTLFVPHSPVRRSLIARSLMMSVACLLTAETVNEQMQNVLDIVDVCMDAVLKMGVDPAPIFTAIHGTNMAKLWPDGKPRWDAKTGKVLKPEGWCPPDIPALLAQQTKRNGVGALMDAATALAGSAAAVSGLGVALAAFNGFAKDATKDAAVSDLQQARRGRPF